jgi:hypothetical protein
MNNDGKKNVLDLVKIYDNMRRWILWKKESQ